MGIFVNGESSIKTDSSILCCRRRASYSELRSMGGGARAGGEEAGCGVMARVEEMADPPQVVKSPPTEIQGRWEPWDRRISARMEMELRICKC